jgi:superfamily II DNA or RNA helicase/HKD family nuclease
MSGIARGLYEELLTSAMERRLTTLDSAEATVAPVDPADQPHVLARHVERAVRSVLAATTDPIRRLAVVNHLLTTLDEHDERISPPARQLQSVRQPPGPGVVQLEPVRPSTPLSEAALLTNARDEPNMGSELRAELDTCDEVDLLCAFVKWYGLRLLERELSRVRSRNVPLRVITTTYMGATDPAALDRLVLDFGAEVKIQYDAYRTRLHAKAWMFRRATTFDTAYVGSSNLSRAALLDGVEWNVRLSRVGTPALLEKFRATFDTYWNDPSFEPYNPARDRDRLDEALAEAAGRKQHDRTTLTLSGLEVRPYPHQQDTLDALEVERVVHDRHRNLVVAATGTGKTVVAALDYRRLVEQAQGRPSLLFVAHRQEILQQSLRTYREVLNDMDFGELYVAGSRPERWQHVFASVQSLTAYGVDRIAPDAYDVVVIDEFHHAGAPTYRRLLDRLQPRELLALTATPERTDGLDVRALFGGRTAAELRLWDALGADLLCPFHYFAVADGTDLRSIAWRRGRYDDAELGNLYTGNRTRAAVVLRQVQSKITNPAEMRALGFCVSVSHAEFMAQTFREAGIPALAVSGDTSQDDRAAALAALRERRVSALFAADLFNEGLDLPDVDTVLMLRPTESATLFLQQLGRGLRRTRDKAVLTVLDFVGHHRQEFRFDHRLAAITGLTRRDLQQAVERGFPFLPSGCQIIMDRQSTDVVLENLRNQLGGRWSQLAVELRRCGDVDLPAFLTDAGLDVADVVRGDRSWTALRRAAGLPTRSGAHHEDALLRRNRALIHVDDRPRAQTYRRLLADDAPAYAELSPLEQRMADMLFFSLWPDGGGHDSVARGIEHLREEPAARDELGTLVDLAFADAHHVAVELGDRFSGLPLRVHGRYQREEILAALGYANLKRTPKSFQTGVLYVPELDVDAFFVTLQKSEADYSPTTMYRDYPISPTLFHWESQSVTTAASPTGQRYISGTSTKLLFIRQRRLDDAGTSPYLFAGPATYVQHTGERPMAITWRLVHPLPGDIFAAATVAAS